VPHAFFGAVVEDESDVLEDSDFGDLAFLELPPLEDELEV
jgi:hypothetical protein